MPDLKRKISEENEQDYCDIAIQRAIQSHGRTDWPKYELDSNHSSSRSSTRQKKASKINYLVQAAFMTTSEIISHLGFGVDLT